MTRTSTALAVAPEIEHKAWIWLSGIEVPESRLLECLARIHGDTHNSWDIRVSWEDRVFHDEIWGKVSWAGPGLSPGDILHLMADDVKIGVLKILEPEA